MIIQCIREHIRRWVCRDCDNCDHGPDFTRLDRAEKLHAFSSLAVSKAAEKQAARVSDMRIAANAAVKRLVHDKKVIEERGDSDL